MMQFAQVFPQSEIVSRVATQLSWSHIVEILPLRDGIQREFYLTLAATQKRDVMNCAAGQPWGPHGCPVPSAIKIGCMKDEVKLPDNFDESFDSLDGEVASMFMGDAS